MNKIIPNSFDMPKAYYIYMYTDTYLDLFERKHRI